MAARFALTAALALALAAPRAEAGKIPLRPEQLEKESKLIVTGQVQSHREEDRPQTDGSVTRLVFLTVKVESVAKGDARPGDSIQVRCWVVVKEPRDGVVWDAGHGGIPGDGGKAKFFLSAERDGAWHAIYPNGIELLDKTPLLRYEREKAELPHIPGQPPKLLTGWPFWAVVGVLVVGAAILAFRNRPRRRA